ncbi:MAG: aminotransferase class I/II-fold pyridoxal phosphate-dependent enzyme [Saprospiraceae bacterium]
MSATCPDIYEQVEAAICAWTGAPAALLVSSGTAAGQLAIRWLPAAGFYPRVAPKAHPALWHDSPTAPSTWQQWCTALTDSRNIGVLDAVDPLSVALPPWDDILGCHPMGLLVDDSHLIGHYGPRGAGSWPSIAGRVEQLVVAASLGKALSLPAGVLLSDRKTIDSIRKMPQFGGASPPSPAFMYAWLHATDILTTQRQRLRQYIHEVHSALADTEAVALVADFPVIGLHHHTWVNVLATRGIIASSFHYPSPEHPRYSRIILRADHTDEEQERLLETLHWVKTFAQ